MITFRRLSRISAGRLSHLHVVMMALTIGSIPTFAVSADGTWNPTGFAGDGTGLWSDPTKWTGGIIANGPGALASFSTLDITNDSIVSLDSSRTIGRLAFADATTNSNNWMLDNAGNAANVLTLDNTGGTGAASITVTNRTATISTVLAGTHGVTITGGSGANLVLSGNNSYSGGTTITRATGGGVFAVVAASNTAFGTGDVHFNPGGSDGARIFLSDGVTINNDIYLDTVRSAAGANAGLQVGNFTTTGTTVTVNDDVSATVNGTIRVAAPATSGGTFVGAMPTTNQANYTAATTANFLTLNGPVIFTTPGTSPKSAAGSGGNIIQQRAGNIRWAGGGSYYRMELRNGVAQLGANNGIAQNAYIDMGGNANVNPANYSIVDLNGFNQTVVGLSNYISQGLPATVTNTSTTSPSTLTLAPVNPTTNPNQANLWLTAGGGAGGALSTQSAAIINVSPNAPLNLVVNGDAAGTQFITTAASAYTGTTTLTSGTLALSSLGDGGFTVNLTTTAGSNMATVDSTAGLAVGQLVISPNVRTYANQGGGGAPTTITAIDTATNTITLSINATGGDGATATPAAFGAGNGLGISSNSASNLVFNGGALSYVRGVPGSATTDGNPVNFTGTSATPSTNRNFTINAGKTGTIDVQNGTTAPNTTVLTMSGGSADTSGALIKTGPGTLVLTGTNLHKGGTTVSGGTLLVNGTGSLSTGAVNISSGATLGGNGTIGGTIIPTSGGIIAPGNGGVGTLTVGGLTLNAGSISNFEFNGAANDQITITGAGGLSINGGGINLLQEGTTSAFSTNGTYTLLNISSGLTGSLNNLTISNPTAGKFYTLSNSPASGVQLTIGTATTVNWNGNTSGSWSLGGNWAGGVSPNAVGTSVRFNGGNLTGVASTTVNIDGGGKTASGVIFNDDSSGNAFNLTGSTLTLNNGVAAAAISVGGGTQTISAPISSASALAVSLTNNSNLNISGVISGGKALSLTGTGALTLTGNNTYSSTNLSAAAAGSATLNIGTLGGSDTTGSLGTGDVAMSGGAVLNFNRSNGYNFAGAITGSGADAGSVNQLGSGTTTIAGAISGVSTVNVAAGSLVASSTISQSGGINVTGVGGIGVPGAGSLTANGSISGAGALSVNTTGTVSLNANNSYSGGTSIAGGTVILNSAAALPANSVLAVNGGTLDLHGNNISLSNITDTTAGGAITNNGPAVSTSKITFVGGNSQDYNLFAAVNDGTGKVAVDTSITNLQTNGVPARILHFHSTGTYSGGTTIHSQSIQAEANNAFGTGPIAIALNNSSTNWSQVFVQGGIAIHNDITVAQGKPTPGAGGQAGVVQFATGGADADADVFGTITIQANNVDGGLFFGAPVGGVSFLNIHSPVNVAGTADTVIQNGGQVKYFGGGNYPNFQLSGTAQLGANNGLSQTAIIQMANVTTAALDLGGFDQSAAALSASSAANQSIVQNTTVNPGNNTLTLNTKGTNNFNGSITGNINLTIAGNGTQIFSGFNSYTGNTRINSGRLQMGVDNGLSASSNVILAGGTLATDGHLQSFTTPLALLANSTIDLGAANSILQFADSHTQAWTAGAVLNIVNWSGNITGSGTDQLLVGDSTKTGLSAAQLGRIHFQGFHTGAALVVNGGNGEVVPANATPLLRGDINQDTHVNNSDVAALMAALTDLNAYKAAHPTLDVFEAGDLLDVDQNGAVTNADLQGLLNYLKAGNGSVAPVPEPASLLLMALGGVACLGIRRGRVFRR